MQGRYWAMSWQLCSFSMLALQLDTNNRDKEAIKEEFVIVNLEIRIAPVALSQYPTRGKL